VPDPTNVTVIGDSKLFCGRTIFLAEELGFDYVTLIPRNVGLRQEAVQRFREIQHESPHKVELFHEKESAKHGEVEQWRGTSLFLVYDYVGEHKRVTRIPLRVVVVESSSLRREGARTLEHLRKKERKRLEFESRRSLVSAHKTEAAARKALVLLEAKQARFHKTTPLIRSEVRYVKRGKRGRPSKNEVRAQETVWRVWFTVESDEASFKHALDEGSCYVLATNHATTGDRDKTDVEIFSLYHEQGQIETAFHWFKGDLNFAPIFLKTPRRIGALAAVYVIALMVHALIARDAHLRLVSAGQKIPGNIQPTNRPSTEVIFRLFESVAATRVPEGVKEPARVLVGNLTTEQLRGYALLGVALENRSRLVIARPRRPGPGDRGYYRPRPRRSRKLRRAKHDP